MKKIPLLLTALFIFSCQQETTNTQKYYFDLMSLINKQVGQLLENKPFTTKMVSINNKTETLKTKDLDWKKELELFQQADINKQAFQLSYAQQQTDSSIVYQLKVGENLPVKSLEIGFDKDKNPTSIKAKIKTKNYLYESEKQLQMILEDKKLKSYEINAWQELFIGEKKVFRIEGRVK